MPEMHRLQADQLHVDQPLPWNVFDSTGQLLLSKGFVIQRDQQISNLLERGMFVDAVEFRAYQPGQVAQRYDPLSLWENVQARLAYVLESLPHDGSMEEEIGNLARQIFMLTDRSPDLALAAIMLMDYRNYPVAHSVHSAIVADLVARRAGWPENERLSLVCAALTMNVSMLRLQMMLCIQREPVTAEQRRQINEHPAESARMLIGCGVEDDEWLRAVLEHHELLNGMGYPRKVRNPSAVAMLVRTADVFCAKVSPRSHRKPIMASEATRAVFTKLSEDGNNPFPALLVKEIGIYPPGSIVRLANGETGVVKKRGPNAKTPFVAALVNAHGLPLLKPVQRQTASDPIYAIVGVLSRDKALIGLNFEQIWGEGT